MQECRHIGKTALMRYQAKGFKMLQYPPSLKSCLNRNGGNQMHVNDFDGKKTGMTVFFLHSRKQLLTHPHKQHNGESKTDENQGAEKKKSNSVFLLRRSGHAMKPDFRNILSATTSRWRPRAFPQGKPLCTYTLTLSGGRAQTEDAPSGVCALEATHCSASSWPADPSWGRPQHEWGSNFLPEIR